ncbi:MAG: hypothetical protein ACLRR1_11145 [Alistipes shahii]|uniref:GREB1-related protein n=1 Tax=Alistipes shahii TaxID=328814 RepID=UPI0039906052
MAMRHNGFVAFILTHGRPDRVLTYEKLRKHGYTGKIYIVCDDEDKTLPEYRKRFGDVLVFFQIGDRKDIRRGRQFRRPPGNHLRPQRLFRAGPADRGDTFHRTGRRLHVFQIPVRRPATLARRETSKTSTRYSTCCSTISIPPQC